MMNSVSFAEVGDGSNMDGAGDDEINLGRRTTGESEEENEEDEGCEECDLQS